MKNRFKCLWWLRQIIGDDSFDNWKVRFVMERIAGGSPVEHKRIASKMIKHAKEIGQIKAVEGYKRRYRFTVFSGVKTQ